MGPPRSRKPIKSKVFLCEKNILQSFLNIFAKSFYANVGHNKSNFCTKGLTIHWILELYTGFSSERFFLLKWCKKVELRHEKHHKCQFKNMSLKVGNIWVFSELNSTDMVYKQNILIFQSFVICQAIFFLTTIRWKRHLPFTFWMDYIKSKDYPFSLKILRNDSSKQGQTWKCLGIQAF